MKNGKYCNKKSLNMKPLALLLALTLLVGCAIGGTIAWLTAQTSTVTNTFTVGDVNITLKESPITVAQDGTVSYGAPEDGVTNAYPVIPGTTYKKDPVVSVVSSTDGNVSEDCWLFVKFVESDKASTYLTYTSNLTAENKWIQGKGTDGIPTNVWYREVKKTDTVKEWKLLAGNETYANGCITIKAEAVTKATMDEAINQSLTYTAYAAQSANLTAAQAWAQFNTTP